MKTTATLILGFLAAGAGCGSSKEAPPAAAQMPTSDAAAECVSASCAPPAPATKLSAIGPMAVGDFDGDGKLDIAAGHTAEEHGISILYGRGDGTFDAPKFFAVGMMPVRFLIKAILNDDALPDLVGVDEDFGMVAEAKRQAASTTVSLGPHFDPAHAGPLVSGVGQNKDQVAQVFGGAPSGLAVLTSDLDGNLATIQEVTIPPVKSMDVVAAGDFNGDGVEDLAAVSSPSNGGPEQLVVFNALGDGTFGAPVYRDLPGSPGKIVGAESGDLGGGAGDALLLLDQTGNLFVDNPGAALNATPSILEQIDRSGLVGMGTPSAMAWLPTGSISDAGGHVAILSSNNDVTVVRIQAGAYAIAPALPVGVDGKPSGFAVGDFNGDGKVDFEVAVQEPNGDTVVTFIDGSRIGTFVEPPPQSTPDASKSDSSAPDASPSSDAAVDSAAASEAGPSDASASDASASDASAGDASAIDASTNDAATSDASCSDATNDVTCAF